MREALFSILGEFVQDARVLDLFAGSGALGLEALSRGAAQATFVDSAAASVAAVRANLEALGGEAEVRRADALRFLGTATGETRQYDLVLLDPPYRLAERLGRELSEALPAVLAPCRARRLRERPPGAAATRPPAERRTTLRRHPDPHP